MTQIAWRLTVVAAAAALLLAGCGPAKPVGAEKASTQVDSTAPAGTTTTTTDEPTTTQAAKPVGPSDFHLAVKLLSQECFGSAGCNIEYRVQVDSGPHTGTYEVTYEVTVPGDENSPYTDTLTVTDGQYEQPFQGSGSPAHRVKASKIKVRVTAVEAQ